jgi:DNA modification methylase
VSVRVLQGHVLDVLAGMAPASVHCVVCSPPYWQLRAYGTPHQVWPDGWVGELGQEPDVDLYVAHLVDVFLAVRRVLRDDGTLWVNLAGCFWNDAGGQNGAQGTISPKAIVANGQQGRTRKSGHPVYKALDYVDVPGLTARALQADGWLWRSDVALVKSAPMPESVSGTHWTRCRVKTAPGPTPRLGDPGDGGGYPAHGHGAAGGPMGGTAEWADCSGCRRCAKTDGLVLRRGSGRPTRAWERLLVFAKKPGYFYDCEAVREPAQYGRREWNGQRPHDIYDAATQGERLTYTTGGKGDDPSAGRNARDWLLWRPQPLKAEAGESEHYAAFPTFLPELAVKAGTSARGCCPGCGAPWARVVDRIVSEVTRKHYAAATAGVLPGTHRGTVERPGGYEFGETTTLGWRPTCACPPHSPRPATVLDCFAGSGTSGIVADRLGRDAVLVELKPQYAELARNRVTRDAPLLTWGAVTLETGASQESPAPVPLLLEAAGAGADD